MNRTTDKAPLWQARGDAQREAFHAPRPSHYRMSYPSSTAGSLGTTGAWVVGEEARDEWLRLAPGSRVIETRRPTTASWLEEERLLESIQGGR